jgi:hypothetical protein
MNERLYNGIELPEVWPPRHLERASDAPMPVPYLADPPAVIPIDVGRQLFVDDFLIGDSTLTRTFHQPEKHPANPVLTAQTPEELSRQATLFLGHGGLWYDRPTGRFQLAYVAGWRGKLSLATSRDLLTWERPELAPGRGNALIDRTIDDHALWFDPEAADGARFKLLELHRRWPAAGIETGQGRPEWKLDSKAGDVHCLATSTDGLSWSSQTPAGPPYTAGDYCSFFYNPFRKRWVFSIRTGYEEGRMRAYLESASFDQGIDWSAKVVWTRADRRDLPEPVDGYPGGGEPCQLYTLNAVAYESLMIGLHAIHRGPLNRICAERGIPKLIDLELGFSRDGFHWDRPDRGGFIRCERREGSWDRGYVHSAAGLCVVLGDRLVFPYTGTSGVAPDGSRGDYCGASIGIASLRRDGFASLDAGSRTGSLTTRPVAFSGARLFVNLRAPQGRLRVAVLDEHGRELAPFTLADCVPVTGDHTLAAVRWQGGEDLSTLRGRPVRFCFELSNGELYAFWVSRDDTGRSDGYVAAGGPGFTGPTDTVGRSAT